MVTENNIEFSGTPELEKVVQDLVKINGIAKKTAEALYEIGIYSYDDLIRYMNEHSLKALSKALKDHGLNRSPAFINRYDWIGEATELKQQEVTTPQQIVDEPIMANTSINKHQGSNSNDHDAIFYVYFDMIAEDEGEQVLQTTVYDEKDSGEEEKFKGFETTPWVSWMLERVNLPGLAERVAIEAQTSDPHVLVTPREIQLEISSVDISVVGPTSDLPEKRLQAEVGFQIFGDEATTAAKESIPFRIEIYTIDMESKSPALIASEKGAFQSGVFSYSKLLKFPIPETVGSYELHTILLLLPPGENMAFHVGPIVNVKP